MKTIIAIAIASIIAIVTLVSMADTSTESVEVKETIGVTHTGKVGVKLNDTLCVNPTNGQVDVCI